MSMIRRERRPQSGRTNRRMSHSMSNHTLERPQTAGQLKRRMGSSKSLPALKPLQKASARPSTHEILRRKLLVEKKQENALMLNRPTDVVIETLIQSVSQSLQQRYTGKSSLRKVFLAWDENHDGVVDPQELEAIFQKCGCNITQKQAQEICRYYGNSNDKIPYEGFLDLVFKDEDVETVHQRDIREQLRERLRQLGVNEQDIKKCEENRGIVLPLAEIIRRLKKRFQIKKSLAKEFRHIDYDKSGTVSVDELHKFLSRCNFESSRDEISDLFRKFDKSGDGCVDYYEFINLVFPAEDIGAFVRLTPRSEADDDERVEVDESKATREIKKEEKSVHDIHTDDLHESLDGGVKDALIAARVKKNIQSKLTKNFKSIHDMFKEMDKDGDGGIDYNEMKASLLKLDLNLNSKEIDLFLRFVDSDHSGFIDFEEFRDYLGVSEDDHTSSEDLGFNQTHHVNGNNNDNNNNNNSNSTMTKRNGQKHHGKAGKMRGKKLAPVQNVKTANSANIGFALSNRVVDKRAVAKQKMKRKLFPKTVHMKNGFCPSDLSAKAKVATRSEHRPAYKDTRYLVQLETKPEKLTTEHATAFQLSEAVAYHNREEQIRKRERLQKRLENKREARNRYVRETEPVYEDPDRRLKTILKHRLNYYSRLSVALENDARRRQDAGY